MSNIALYCEEANVDALRVLQISPSITYAELSDRVEKKFTRPMTMAFYQEDGDKIALDDDDTLAMFLAIRVRQTDDKQVRLLCSPVQQEGVACGVVVPSTSSLVPAGGILGTLGMMVAAPVVAQPYSNGELQVKEVCTYVGHAGEVYSCAFSSNGDQFVTGSGDKSVRLWNTKTGSCTEMKGGHDGLVLSCDFSPKGNRVVSSSGDRTIKVWNTTKGVKIAKLKGHDDKVYCVQYNPTGEYIVSGSCDHTVKVWNAETCSKVSSLKGHTQVVFSCAFSRADGGKQVVSGSADRLIKIWDWKSRKEVRSLTGHGDTVWSVCFSSDDKYVVSSSMDHELKLWNSATGACIRTMTGHASPIHQAIFSADDKYIFSCARDRAVRVWRAEDGEHVEAIVGHEGTVYHMDVLGNKLLTASLDRSLKLWEIQETGAVTKTMA